MGIVWEGARGNILGDGNVLCLDEVWLQRELHACVKTQHVHTYYHGFMGEETDGQRSEKSSEVSMVESRWWQYRLFSIKFFQFHCMFEIFHKMLRKKSS